MSSADSARAVAACIARANALVAVSAGQAEPAPAPAGGLVAVGDTWAVSSRWLAAVQDAEDATAGIIAGEVFAAAVADAGDAPAGAASAAPPTFSAAASRRPLLSKALADRLSALQRGGKSAVAAAVLARVCDTAPVSSAVDWRRMPAGLLDALADHDALRLAALLRTLTGQLAQAREQEQERGRAELRQLAAEAQTRASEALEALRLQTEGLAVLRARLAAPSSQAPSSPSSSSPAASSSSSPAASSSAAAVAAAQGLVDAVAASLVGGLASEAFALLLRARAMRLGVEVDPTTTSAASSASSPASSAAGEREGKDGTAALSPAAFARMLALLSGVSFRTSAALLTATISLPLVFSAPRLTRPLPLPPCSPR